MTGSNLGLRLLVAGVGIPFGFAVVWAGGWIMTAVVLLLGLLACHEVLGFARAGGWRPFTGVALPVTALLILGAGWFGAYAPWGGMALGLLLAATIGSLILAIFLRGAQGGPMPSVGFTLLATVYVAVPMALMIFLRQHPASSWSSASWDGTFLLVFPLLVTWVADSSAYFGGRRFGNRKLIPAVSPSKTVEGAVSGVIGAMASAAAFTAVLLPTMGGGLQLSVSAAALLGLLVGTVAQLGDLAESLLKREAGVKDSGSLLPGHGGVMDRFDAVLFTVPVTYLMIPFFIGWGI
ncbi:MAG: phosphatidate cytidylyltransferase [Gemmatimonadales bacterium]|nr:MAG: phosphatidate cytidylyltransferase [Gemmatimonadales bacterium]